MTGQHGAGRVAFVGAVHDERDPWIVSPWITWGGK